MKSHPTITDLLQPVKELVAIESTAENPTGLRAAYDYIREFIRASGKNITIEEFERNNKPSFIAYRGQERPEQFHIIFSAHLDVVTGPAAQFQPFVDGDKLYGRGVYDMKAAAIVMAQVFCEYVEKVPYALGFQAVTDEESGGASCAEYQTEQGIRADFAICGECGRTPGTFEIANETKGFAVLKLEFFGNSAHGAYPWRGDNAAVRATEFLRKLHEHFPVPEEATTATTVTVTSISTGITSHSQIPELATVRLDCRYAPDDRRFDSITAASDFFRTLDPNVTITQIVGFCAPMRSDPQNPLLLELKAAAEQIEGTAFSFVRRNGTGDGRFFTQSGGEACEFGIPGEYQHADDECITLTAFQNYLATMRLFLQKTLPQ